MINKESYKKLCTRTITATILLALAIPLFVYAPTIYSSIALGTALLIILLFEWPRFFDTRTTAFWLIMPIYPIMPFAMLIALNQNQLYRPLVALAFILAALFDSGSYLVGTIFGRHTIAPAISPNKTWEGLLGGTIVTIALLIAWQHQRFAQHPLLFIALVTIGCFVSFLGDTFESWLKRRAKIKDSGDILPGHGGLLDRLDGVLFIACGLFLLKDILVQLLY